MSRRSFRHCQLKPCHHFLADEANTVNNARSGQRLLAGGRSSSFSTRHARCGPGRRAMRCTTGLRRRCTKGSAPAPPPHPLWLCSPLVVSHSKPLGDRVIFTISRLLFFLPCRHSRSIEDYQFVSIMRHFLACGSQRDTM